MGEVSYKPLIEDMTWSYSRVVCFYDCRYKWFSKYIHGDVEKPMFYASYGSFMHKLIEQFYRGELSIDDMKSRFLLDFKKEVKGDRPSEKIVQNYIANGLSYLSSFSPFPYNMIDVEKYIEFDVDGIPARGYIDYVGEKDGDYYIVDNKSRDLKPRSKRKTPTKKDEELDAMLRQLYIYAHAVKQIYGKLPVALCFNCFKSGTFIEEPFNEDRYREAIDWFKSSVAEITETDSDDFYPSVEFFNCRYLCGLQDDCCYLGN